MGLLSAINTAISGLNVNQQNLSVLSQNIANANTHNYSTEVVNQQASFINGIAQGVTVASITRQVDNFLNTEVQTQTSTNSSASAVQSYYQQVENLLGQPGSTGTLDQNISTFFNAVQDLANSPSVSAQTTVANTGAALATQISSLAGSLQTLRLQSDNEIGTSVNNVNQDLKTLYSINSGLELATATNENTSGLLDQRDAALNDLAQYVDIKTNFQADGAVSVSTNSGISLVGQTLGQLNYTPTSSTQTLIDNDPLSAITVSSTDANGNSIGRPVPLATGGVSSSVTTSLNGGKIKGLLSVRDSVLPNILSQLDTLASSLRDSVNAINNAGTSFPPPNSYTGTRLVSGSTTSQYSGSIQIAVLGANGTPVSSPYADEPNGLQPLTLNLATLNTGSGAGIDSVDGIVNAINQYFQPQSKAELGNINNVQLQVASPTVPATGNTMSFDFNLNNITSSSANVYVTGVSVLDNNGNPAGATAASVPGFNVSSFATSANSNVVTLNVASTAGLSEGQTIYMNPPTTSSINGISNADLSGTFTVHIVNGTQLQITAANADPSTVTTGTASGAGAEAIKGTGVGSGQTVNTAGSALVTADLSNAPSAPYYTVQANVVTIDSDGTSHSSTITYQVTNGQQNSMNNLIGAKSATGDGTIVNSNVTQPLAVATLVDASGNPLTKVNGSYGNQQGYLKIIAGSSTYSVAINELDSQQLGLPNSAPPVAGTNQGFSQYFGLNNFFNTNSPTATGDTLAGSAINLSVESRITANPSLVSTGRLTQSNQPADASAPPNFTYQVSSGDNSISQAMAGLASSAISFSAAGGMPVSNTTFSQYAGQIIATTSTNSTNVTNSVTDSQTLLSGFTTRAQTVSGVNLDQELANTVIYQNAYTASTRVITVVSNLFDQLMNIIH